MLPRTVMVITERHFEKVAIQLLLHIYSILVCTQPQYIDDRFFGLNQLIRAHDQVELHKSLSSSKLCLPIKSKRLPKLLMPIP